MRERELLDNVVWGSVVTLRFLQINGTMDVTGLDVIFSNKTL